MVTAEMPELQTKQYVISAKASVMGKIVSTAILILLEHDAKKAARLNRYSDWSAEIDTMIAAKGLTQTIYDRVTQARTAQVGHYNPFMLMSAYAAEVRAWSAASAAASPASPFSGRSPVTPEYNGSPASPNFGSQSPENGPNEEKKAAADCDAASAEDEVSIVPGPERAPVVDPTPPPGGAPTAAALIESKVPEATMPTIAKPPSQLIASVGGVLQAAEEGGRPSAEAATEAETPTGTAAATSATPTINDNGNESNAGPTA